MNPATHRAIKAILEADPSLSGSQRNSVLRACMAPEPERPPQNSSRPQFVSAREASEILNTSKRTVWRLAKIGKIRRIKLGHRSTRFRLDDIANITSIEDTLCSDQEESGTPNASHQNTASDS